MKKLQLYIETSVWNFYFADDSPEKKEYTIQFFDNVVSKGLCEVYISDAVTREILQAEEDVKNKLFNLINKFDSTILDITGDVNDLANIYLNECALPSRAIADATHAAVSTVYGIDCLISWNLKHLANLNRIKKINSVNLKSGYRQIDIFTPMEVLYYGE